MPRGEEPHVEWVSGEPDTPASGAGWEPKVPKDMLSGDAAVDEQLLAGLKQELSALEAPSAGAARPYAGASAADAAAAMQSGAALEMSKTDASQKLKGKQSYYYWHSDAERRRQLGEQAVPPPEPKKLGTAPAAPKAKVARAISTFSFLDDGDVVKVYIPLDGELAGASMDDIEVEFAERSLQVVVQCEESYHRFVVDRLAHEVQAPRCKARVVKSGKLVLTLHKRNHIERWAKLRAVGA